MLDLALMMNIWTLSNMKHSQSECNKICLETFSIDFKWYQNFDTYLGRHHTRATTETEQNPHEVFLCIASSDGFSISGTCDERITYLTHSFWIGLSLLCALKKFYRIFYDENLIIQYWLINDVIQCQFIHVDKVWC